MRVSGPRAALQGLQGLQEAAASPRAINKIRKSIASLLRRRRPRRPRTAAGGSQMLLMLRPLLWTSRLLGVWPMHLHVGVVSRRWLLYSRLICASLTCLCATIAYRQPVTTDVRERVINPLSMIAYHVDVVVQLLGWALALSSFLARGSWTAARVMRSLDSHPLHSKHAKSVSRDVRVFTVLGVLLPMLGMSLVSWPSLWVRPSLYGLLTLVAFAAAHSTATMLDLQFTELVHALRLQLAFINARLMLLQRRGARGDVFSTSRYCSASTPLGLDRSLHLKVVDMGRHLSRAYGFPILINLVAAGVQLTTISYMMIDWVREGERSIALGHVALCLLLILRILRMSTACGMAYEEERFTARNVGLICNMTKLTESEQAENKLRFTACGLFDIDDGLITSMVATVLMYFIIMVQFQVQDVLGPL